MSTETMKVDVLAVVETYSCAMANGVEHGWTVKVGEDVLEDFRDEESAVAYADSYNAALARSEVSRG